VVMIMPAGVNSCPIYQSFLVVLPAETSGTSKRNGRMNENFVYSVDTSVDLLHVVKSYDRNFWLYFPSE
jgi:hypothetical protein